LCGRPFLFRMVIRDPFLAGNLRRVAPLAAVVVALHVALLAVPLRSARTPDAPTEATAMQVRLLARSGDTAAAEATVPPPGGNDRAAELPMQRQPASFRPEPAGASPPQPAYGVVPPVRESDADYYPRAALSRAPAALDAIVIDYPPIAGDGGHHVSELSLFIDEAGRVTRVRVDGQALPTALEEAARVAFMGARFRAGEVDGHAVKSRIRVEVVFENGPPGSPK
jgi:hypothetical protein